MTETDRFLFISFLAILMFSMISSDPAGLVTNVFDFVGNIVAAYVIALILRD